VLSVAFYFHLFNIARLTLRPPSGSRNTTDSSSLTQKSKRPDLLIYVNEVALFRGEEETSKLETAFSDLRKKLSWNHGVLGSLPYILGYAANKDYLQFFALDQK